MPNLKSKQTPTKLTTKPIVLDHAAMMPPFVASPACYHATVLVRSAGSQLEGPMRLRWVIMAALLLLAMGGAALPEAWAGDFEDCSNGQALIKTEPARVIGACRRLAEQGVAFAQFDLGLIYYYGQNVPQS